VDWFTQGRKIAMEVWEKFATALEWILRAVVAYLVIRAIEYGAKSLNRPQFQIFISEENTARYYIIC
jgi:hypothetical protein